MDKPSVQNQLALLQDQFRASLKERGFHLVKLKAALSGHSMTEAIQPSDLAEHLSDTLAEIADLAHKLVGGSATFGFPDITEPARGVEKSARAIRLQLPAKIPDTFEIEIENLISVLKTALLDQPASPSVAKDMDPADHRILIVDDDVALAKLAVAILQKSGYQLEYRDTPSAVIAAVNEFKPDLVLLDYNIGDVLGSDLLAELKTVFGSETPKVLFFSGVQNEDLKADLLKAGASGFIQKPFQPGNLIKAVTDAFS